MLVSYICAIQCKVIEMHTNNFMLTKFRKANAETGLIAAYLLHVASRKWLMKIKSLVLLDCKQGRSRWGAGGCAAPHPKI